jgi:hypothetical protein
MDQNWPKASGARPSPATKSAQGVGAALRTERSHRMREHPRRHGGALATDAAVAG